MERQAAITGSSLTAKKTTCPIVTNSSIFKSGVKRYSRILVWIKCQCKRQILDYFIERLLGAFIINYLINQQFCLSVFHFTFIKFCLVKVVCVPSCSHMFWIWHYVSSVFRLTDKGMGTISLNEKIAWSKTTQIYKWIQFVKSTLSQHILN